MNQSEIVGAKNNWPHKFVKIGPEELHTVPGHQVIDAIKVVPMQCICCNIKYVQGKDPQPAGPCPARNDRDELKRLHGR